MSLRSLRSGAPRQRGFTLIELSVVVAILGIIAAIAIPSYNESVRRTRRSLAQACLVSHAQLLERNYTRSMSYLPAPAFTCSTDVTSFYTPSYSSATTATAFALQMLPIVGSSQAGDRCGLLTLDNRGVRGAALPTNCW